VPSQGGISQCPCPGTSRCEEAFFLYVHKRSGRTGGELTQYLGSWHQLMAYLSKKLGLIGKGIASLPVGSHSHSLASIRDNKKLTLGGEVTVQVPQSVVTLMEHRRQYWLTNARMIRYQSVLCENPQVKLEVVWTLNLQPSFHRLQDPQTITVWRRLMRPSQATMISVTNP
jgi:hypothetical protein